MKLFLAWRDARPTPAALAPELVKERLLQRFGPLFKKPPKVRLRSAGPVHVLLLELRVKGWSAPFFEEHASDGRWVFAPDYPLNARRALDKLGVASSPDTVLGDLAAALAQGPERLLADLTPPFALLDGDSTGLRYQTDAMGQSQAFACERGPVWALTSHVTALHCLDLPLVPEPVEWATRFTLGWFPLDTSGFRDVRHVAPGTRFTADAHGVHEERFDILDAWVNPPVCAPQDALEQARASFLDLIRDASPHWDTPSVGLSGGWDSRAVMSCLRHLGEPVELRVRGSRMRFDAVISSMLAQMAGLELRIKTSSGLPPFEPAAIRACTLKALVWQGGALTTLKNKTFLSRKAHLAGGVVNVMGQHGGFGKADFAVKIGAHELPVERYEEALVAKLLRGMPPHLAAEWKDGVRELIVKSIRQADRYGLEGLRRLHFYFLYEYTRRWSSASLASQSGLVFAPFLNPEFIRAAYAYPAEEHPTKPFHRFITGTLAPDWAQVPYEDQVSKEDLANGRLVPLMSADEAPPADLPAWAHPKRYSKYDYAGFWNTAGAPLLEDALASEGGLHTQLFDTGAPLEDWIARAKRGSTDELVLAHLLPRALADAPLDELTAGT